KDTKLRIVFDSAAKVEDVPLNNMLEKGPCLFNDLTGILLIAGDISKMFLRVYCISVQLCNFWR
ncbi:predicted protein, partial [Nematostella vectensis]